MEFMEFYIVKYPFQLEEILTPNPLTYINLL